MVLTKGQLLEELYKCSPAELQEPVTLRDYASQETIEASDFVSGQIGFNADQAGLD